MNVKMIKAKQAAAQRACDFVEEGMMLGLGSGSTAEIFVSLLAARKMKLRAVATSERVAALAQRYGFELADSTSFTNIDLTVDGADEVDRSLNLIKGLGGALLREKIVAQSSRRLIIIADDSKQVDMLGAQSPVPVEVLGFGREAARYGLAALVGNVDDVRLRRDRSGKPFRTDNENYIYDCFFGRLTHPVEISAELDKLPFIVAHGLFLGMADMAVIGYDNGETKIAKTKTEHSNGP